MTKISHQVKDLNLAKEGKTRIEWAGQNMPVLKAIRERFAKEKPLKGVTLGACLHVTSETANLVLTLVAGGARVVVCGCNPLSTNDSVAASLVKDYGIPTFAIKGEDQKTYYQHINQVLDFKPQLTMDDGGDLIAALHKLKIQNSKLKITIQNSKLGKWDFIGSNEETTTGVIRLRAMEKDGALKVPVVAVNESDTKHMFDNRYGTGQSTIDGILRSTNILLAGKTVVVVGYGFCGKGVAMRSKGMGASVIVVETDAVRALEAAMDGFAAATMTDAAKMGDVFVTVTGDKNVIDVAHIKLMKDGAILANSGHFNAEINVAGLTKLAKTTRTIRPFLDEYRLKNGKRVYLLGEGRLINLVAADGHPAEVMDMSFANQALAAEYLVKNRGKLSAKVHVLPKELDQMVARLKLKAMGMGLEALTREQQKYLTSWQEGT